MPVIRLDLLGRVRLVERAEAGDRPIGVSPKPLLLLATLALAAARERSLGRDTLLGYFWPELSELRARGALRQTLFQLRQALGEDTLSAAREQQLALREDTVSCDVIDL